MSLLPISILCSRSSFYRNLFIAVNELINTLAFSRKIKRAISKIYHITLHFPETGQLPCYRWWHSSLPCLLVRLLGTPSPEDLTVANRRLPSKLWLIEGQGKALFSRVNQYQFHALPFGQLLLFWRPVSAITDIVLLLCSDTSILYEISNIICK